MLKSKIQIDYEKIKTKRQKINSRFFFTATKAQLQERIIDAESYTDLLVTCLIESGGDVTRTMEMLSQVAIREKK